MSVSRRPTRGRDQLGRPVKPDDPSAVEPVDETPRPPAETLADASRLLALGRAFAAHEVLESRWKSCPAAERDLWQGLAQVCVGVTHGQRGNALGGARLLRRGAGRLGAYGGPSRGVPVDAVIEWAERAAAALDRPAAPAPASPAAPAPDSPAAPALDSPAPGGLAALLRLGPPDTV